MRLGGRNHFRRERQIAIRRHNEFSYDNTDREDKKIDARNEIKSYIVREDITMTELVKKLAFQYGWSASVPNFSGKLRRNSLRYREAVELADVLGYDIVWRRRGGT